MTHSRLLGIAVEAGGPLAEDFAFIGRLPSDVIELLAPLVLRFLLAPGADFAAELDTFATAHSLKSKPVRSACRTLLLYFGAARNQIANAALIKEDLVGLGVPEASATVVCESWNRLGPSAVVAAAGTGEPAPSTLVDVDWRFGVTVSTDDVARVGSTFVHLKLTLNNGGSLVDEHVELSLSQFYELLAELERGRSYVDFMAASGVAAH